MRKAILLVLNLVVLVATGCSVTGPRPAATNTPLVKISPLVSPLRGGPVRFQIDRPLKAGDTVVKGKGPAGIPIVIANVTTMGNELGAGVIGPDNRFAITVQPLVANTRIGVKPGNLEGTGHTYEEFFTPEYQGEGAQNIPLVDNYLDTVLAGP